MEHSIRLQKGKEYIIYIAYCFASSFPVVQLYKKYNPIFICAENHIDTPENNFISVREGLVSLGMEVSIANLGKIIMKSKKIAGLFDSLKS